jgi:hypothetical protein
MVHDQNVVYAGAKNDAVPACWMHAAWQWRALLAPQPPLTPEFVPDSVPISEPGGGDKVRDFQHRQAHEHWHGAAAIRCAQWTPLRSRSALRMIATRQRKRHLVAEFRADFVPNRASFDHSQTTTVLPGRSLDPACAALYIGLRL